MRNRQEYNKAYYESRKEERKEYMKAYYQAHKEEMKAYMKAYYQDNKEKVKEYYHAHKDKRKPYYQAYMKEYNKTDVNSLGQTKASIRKKSRQILKQMHLHIDGYETHHCFGYEDPSKFIYISKALHRKIHNYLRDNNIDASSDHWMQIREIVNSTDEFMYIKC